jgi:hypothetical protein
MSTVTYFIHRKEIVLFSKQSVSTMRPAKLPIQWVLGLTVIQLLGCGAEWRWATSTPRRPICSHGKCKDNFTFLFYFSFIIFCRRNCKERFERISCTSIPTQEYQPKVKSDGRDSSKER